MKRSFQCLLKILLSTFIGAKISFAKFILLIYFTFWAFAAFFFCYALAFMIGTKHSFSMQFSVGIGELDLFGESRSGFTGLSLDRKVQVEGAEATLQIEARLGIGDLKVQYLPAIPGEIK